MNWYQVSLKEAFIEPIPNETELEALREWFTDFTPLLNAEGGQVFTVSALVSAESHAGAIFAIKDLFERAISSVRQAAGEPAEISITMDVQLTDPPVPDDTSSLA